ncbi:acetyl-CoA carboxylase biotin carboxyl carrier protein subunit [Candidatus Formimonas warabiya]|uniref:Acetyl-CoA carboxylase biotin carboxyl carrier protein subunit n=1 Tax=Formimonas warabiya TaxID=1761012 RepID=A0A3G1KPR6_FORW1|nr:acetyl-CoA carboxylase biotin carboxyl carrier protein subunit [Candidatus Formimonas warabiya]ATW24451.1 acetyl-CoA carboxylase biotin carboxyl carrier protein subunit [Candidatus Formimonas warabiya]
MKKVVSPMPGKVVKINVSQGDCVKNDQEVIIIESMKMEIPVCSQNSGKVMEINVSEGDAVPQGTVLLAIE